MKLRSFPISKELRGLFEAGSLLYLLKKLQKSYTRVSSYGISLIKDKRKIFISKYLYRSIITNPLKTTAYFIKYTTRIYYRKSFVERSFPIKLAVTGYRSCLIQLANLLIMHVEYYGHHSFYSFYSYRPRCMCTVLDSFSNYLRACPANAIIRFATVMKTRQA